MTTARVLAIMGPTAAGKTALACALADRLPVHLISVDSALIYRGMDIGSGKPTVEEQQQYPHALIDICDPAQSYSAARFVADAMREIGLALNANKIPLLVGGTMMYFRALTQGLAPLPDADPELRARLQAQWDERGAAAMHARLQTVDAVAAARIAINDPQRILRAIEVFELSGEPLSELQKRTSPVLPYPLIQIAVQPAQRQLLAPRIEARFDAMLKQGLVEEVQGLKVRADLHADLPSIRCVGYRQVWDYLDGRLSFEQMREQAIIATRGLAKRQTTWLRDWPLDLRVPDAGAESLQYVLKCWTAGSI